MPLPRPSWWQRLEDWANDARTRPARERFYEFSVGKYRYPGALADRWEFVRIPAEEFERAAESQKVAPLLLMRNGYGKRWWWYLDRFYRESVGLTPGEVHEQVLRIRQAEAEERARLLGERRPVERTHSTPAETRSATRSPERGDTAEVGVPVEEPAVRATAA